jgi:SAM-dependent methyltransferase
VDEQLDVTNADIRALPFADGSFDAVVSGLALHHIEGFDSRVHALREIARVLAPEGRVVLIDRFHTHMYVDALRACNLVDVTRSRRVWRVLPPARYVVGTKPEVSVRARRTAGAVEEQVPVSEEEVVAAPAPEDQVDQEDQEILDLEESESVVTVRIVTGVRDGASDESEDGASV